MASTGIGKLPPRYSFMLNPHSEVRLSKCPRCQKRTHPRKFALFIYVDEWGPMVLGKTCRYCSACELIMAHQDELEAELAHTFGRIAPGIVGNEYVVLGTIDTKVWRAGLEGRGGDPAMILEHVAEFEKEYDLVYEPGGWHPADEGSRKMSPNEPDVPSDAIPPALRQRYEDVVRLADTVCREHLNDDYAELAREMAAELSLREPSPLQRGRPESWACGIVYALGRINFLFDKSQTPHPSSAELCKLFGVSPATGSSKARAILDQLDSFQLDPRWCLPGLLEANPLAWIVEIDGLPVDARWLPLEVQEELARLGVIPYVPEPDQG